MSTSESDPTRVVYRIPNWDKQFENSRTRGINSLNYLNWSNRFDSDSYVDIIAGPDGPLHWGIYSALCMVASLNEPPQRGMLLRENGQPHTAQSLADKTRIPVGLLTNALTRLSKLGRVEELVATTDPPASPQLINGRAHPKPKPENTAVAMVDQEFDKWCARWFEVTKKRTNQEQARVAWNKYVVPLADRAPFYACFENYLASGDVSRGAVMNREKWLRLNAADGWVSRWPPPLPDRKKPDAEQGVEQYVRENAGKGHRPI